MRRTRRTMVGLAGIAATVLLHSLLFAVAVWDGGHQLHPRLPDAVGAGANSGEPEAEPGERRMTIMLSLGFDDATPPLEPPPQLTEPVMEVPSVLAITGPDALPLPPVQIELPGEEAEAQDAQLMARAKFAGIYESQVRARIERAWVPPSQLAPDPEFSCLVQILQQRDGRVREVALVLTQCNGSPDWQQSLVNAIQAASPLPAPPNPGVFVDRFALMFHSSALTPAGRTVQR